MTKKKDPILRKLHRELGESPEAWNACLQIMGLPEELPERRGDVSETTFTCDDGDQIPLDDIAGLQVKLGTEPPTGLAKVSAEYSGLEYAPTERWKRSQSFMRIMARIFASKNRLSKRQRAELLKIVDDFVPNGPLPRFDPACWGSPEDFLERWRGHEVDVRFVFDSRSRQVFELWSESIPPDEPEDLDEAGEPSGHWDGLKWTAKPTEIGGS